MIKPSPLCSESVCDLSQITPFVLTYNEEPNIGRCLAQLSWASRIVVLDSGSTDRTIKLIQEHPRARVFHRAFDSHSLQSNYALSLIETPWVLSLDADYLLTPAFVRMLGEGDWQSECAYFAPFRMWIGGRPLRTSLYPPRAILFARKNARYVQDGHTQRLDVSTRRPVFLPEPINHDDRKTRNRWHDNQIKYAELEARKLSRLSPASLNRADRIRRTGWLAPLVILPYLLLVRGLLRDGSAGLRYCLDRTLVEIYLCFALLKRRLRVICSPSKSESAQSS